VSETRLQLSIWLYYNSILKFICLHHPTKLSMILQRHYLHYIRLLAVIESVFFLERKTGPFKMMYADRSCIDSFQQLGISWTVRNNLLLRIDKFLCKMRSYKQPNLNDLRYMMHCSKDGKTNAYLPPPWNNTLHQHILQANYQIRNWRFCLENSSELLLQNNNHDWCVAGTNELEHLMEECKACFWRSFSAHHLSM